MDQQFGNLNSKDFISLSTSIPSSTSRTRKNEKLQAIYDRQQAKNQLQIMVNRVNQLKKIKKQADQEIGDLKKEIRDERERNELKNKIAEERRKSLSDYYQFMDEKRKSVKKNREDRKKNIKDFEHSILKRKKTIVQDKKVKTRIWNNERQLNRSQDLEDKIKKYKSVKNGYVRSLRARCLTQRSHREKLKEEYYESIQQEKQAELDAQDEISQLEIAESNLIQELSATIDIKKGLQENLKKLKLEY